MSTPPTESDIINQARLAVAAYFIGNDRSLSTARFELEGLRAMVRDYDAALAKDDTTRLEKPT